MKVTKKLFIFQNWKHDGNLDRQTINDYGYVD